MVRRRISGAVEKNTEKKEIRDVFKQSVSHVYSVNHNAWRKEQSFILKIRGCF